MVFDYVWAGKDGERFWFVVFMDFVVFGFLDVWIGGQLQFLVIWIWFLDVLDVFGGFGDLLVGFLEAFGVWGQVLGLLGPNRARKEPIGFQTRARRVR